MLLKQTEDEARHEMAKLVRQVEEEARREADRRARNILSLSIQRTAANHVAETTVSVVNLPSDDMKGRIIGREGRNIRTLENITGIDFIIDDTPEAVVLSGFDGVRRETARLTLTKLITDGRIHPARIEETYNQAKAEVEAAMEEAGEQACFDTNVHGVAPELVRVLGRLKYRTSYGQNVLNHSIEVAHLAGIMAAELGANVKIAKRAGLLHDIGKAVDHEVDGSHADISQQLCKKYRESQSVCHAIQAHHQDIEPQTIEAVLVQAADAISAARPGARRESLENYVKRLESLEHIAESKKGVEKCFAMQAGPRGARHGQAGRDRRRRHGAAGPRDRPRDRGPARLPGPDQGHRDPREPRRRHRQVGGGGAAGATAAMRTYYLRSFGCQMNEHDAERIRALLEAEGLERADDARRRRRARLQHLHRAQERRRAPGRAPGHRRPAQARGPEPHRPRHRLPAAGRAGRLLPRASPSSTAPSARRTCTACRSCWRRPCEPAAAAGGRPASSTTARP